MRIRDYILTLLVLEATVIVSSSAIIIRLPSGGSSFTPLYLTPQIVAGNFDQGTTNKNEVSGMHWARLSANAGKFIACHDSSNTLFVHDKFGRDGGTITLTGATLTDAEAVAVTSESTPRVIIGAFGDNSAARTTKQLFIFDEPVLGGTVTIPNDGSYEQVDFVYPASPLWTNGAGGSVNRGDAESLFVADNKLWIISKREEIPKIFSLPLQSSYTGTQTMTYEGLAYDIPDVAGPSGTGNAVDACISSDERHVLVVTYGQVWRWSRTTLATSIPDLLATAPEELNYMGIGSHPTQQPQGESISFDADDEAVYFLSETGTGSTAIHFPLFKSWVSLDAEVVEYVVREGVDSFAGTADTYVNEGANEGVNYGTQVEFIADDNASDFRYGLLRFDGVDTHLDAIDPNMVVVGGALDLTINSEGIAFNVYEITNAAKAWVEGTVTWTSLGGIVVGTDTPTTPIAAIVNTDTRTGTMQLPIPPDTMARIVAGTCHGLLFTGEDLDGTAFKSSEDATPANRPGLRVQYNPDPDAPTPAVVSVQQGLNGYSSGEDTYWHQAGAGAGTDFSTVTSIISDNNVSDWRYGYHRWGGLDSVLPADATITSVEIDFYVNTEGQGMNLHQILTAMTVTHSYTALTGAGLSLARDDDDVASAVVASWPGVDTYTGTITIASTAGLVALVQSWYDSPSTNHGLLGVASHADDGQQVDSNEGATQGRKPLLRITYTTPPE